MSTLGPCQCKMKWENALFLSERISDLTITFPSYKISYPAHRLMMAKDSLYFEKLFYGPMAMKDHEWKVMDVDPEIFKIILAHCYDLNLLTENVETIIQVYKLADCYLIDSLKSQCLEHILNSISKDIKLSKFDYPHILEWSIDYGFIDMKIKVLESISTIMCTYGKWDILSNLPFETRNELLNLCKKKKGLMFQDSWRNPEIPLSSEVLESILEHSSGSNEFIQLQGCFSPEFLNRITTTKDNFLDLSLADSLHSQALYNCVKNFHQECEDLQLTLHIPCNRISPNDLAIWSSISEVYSIVLSDLTDQHVQWAIQIIMIFKSAIVLSLPRSSLSISGFKTVISSLDSSQIYLEEIDICSCNISEEVQDELNTWVKIFLKYADLGIFDTDDMDHW